ncbi:hypothetical protein LJR029_001186 [Caballeronia sp. LjRoot29]
MLSKLMAAWDAITLLKPVAACPYLSILANGGTGRDASAGSLALSRRGR